MRRIATRNLFLLSFLSFLAAALAACGGSTAATTTPSTPATTTDTFSGSVVQLGTDVHPFAVSASGTVTMTLTAVAPLATMALGVGIGTWDGTTCTAVTQNDNARVGTTALTGTAAVGSYCVRVYDSGNIPDGWTVTYTVQVVHP